MARKRFLQLVTILFLKGELMELKQNIAALSLLN